MLPCCLRVIALFLFLHPGLDGTKCGNHRHLCIQTMSEQFHFLEDFYSIFFITRWKINLISFFVNNGKWLPTRFWNSKDTLKMRTMQHQILKLIRYDLQFSVPFAIKHHTNFDQERDKINCQNRITGNFIQDRKRFCNRRTPLVCSLSLQNISGTIHGSPLTYYEPCIDHISFTQCNIDFLFIKNYTQWKQLPLLQQNQRYTRNAFHLLNNDTLTNIQKIKEPMFPLPLHLQLTQS